MKAKKVAWGRVEDILEEDAKAAHRVWARKKPKVTATGKRKGKD